MCHRRRSRVSRTKIAKDGLGVISIDAFDGEGNVPERLVSREFFRLCSEKLKVLLFFFIIIERTVVDVIMNCFNGVRGSTAREFVHDTLVIWKNQSDRGNDGLQSACNVIVVALKRVDECREENEDARFRYARDTLVRLAREGFERGNAKEWDAGEKVEGIFWVFDADVRKKTMREIEPIKNTRHFFTRSKKEGKYRGRNGTYMPKNSRTSLKCTKGRLQRQPRDTTTNDGRLRDDDDDEKR